MFEHAKFSDDLEDIIIDVSDKFYFGSDISMSDKEFSKLSGIDEELLNLYDSWCILDDGIYFFKNQDIFEELFMSELAYECTVRSVSFIIARDNSIPRISDIGIISKLYREKDKEYLMYSDFCNKYFDHVVTDLCLFKKSSDIAFGNERTGVLMNDIFRLISFDIFSGQFDRWGEHNLFFECGKDNVRLAPLCDNGLVFDKELCYFSPFGKYSLSLDDGEYYNNLLKRLREEAVFYDCFLKLIDIDIEGVLKRTCAKYKLLIEDVDKIKILKYFDDRKMAISNVLKLVNKM